MQAKHLPAAQGWLWIKRGYWLFMKAPLLWIVLLLIGLGGVLALSAIPVIGEPLSSLLMPVMMIGLMFGCHELLRGEELELAHLFVGLQKHTSQLITLGGIALVAQYLIFGVMMLVGGAALVGLLMNSQATPDPEIFKQAMAGAGLAVFVGITLFGILLMAMQFAPLLVFFNQISPIAAMKLSLRAYVDNIGAMFIYGTAFLLLAMLASIPMMLGWLVLLPLMFTSVYAAYLDIFPAPPVATEQTPEVDPFKPNQDTF